VVVDHAHGKWNMTPTQLAALKLITKLGPISCANLGDYLWGINGKGGSNCSCPFARPAGKVIAGLVKLGLVERCRVRNEHRTLYMATHTGRKTGES